MTDLKPDARRAAEKEQSGDDACLKNADVVKKVADDAAVKNAPKMAANKLAPLFVADAFFRRAERFHDQRGFFQEIFNTGRDDFIEIKVNFMYVADQARIALFILECANSKSRCLNHLPTFCEVRHNTGTLCSNLST